MQTLRVHRSRGFSLVELMVAMLIGLIGTIVIFQVFEVSEGIKRSTTSGGDAQQNGAVALYVMEHDLRNAGMGFNEPGFAGCPILAYDDARATKDFSFLLAPVLICDPASTDPGGMCPGGGKTGTDPDQLSVFYGSQSLVASAALIAAPLVAPGDGTFSVKNPYGFHPGDLLVLLQPPVNTSKCSLLEVTQLASQLITHAVAGTSYALANGTGAVSRMNKPSGLGVGYAGTLANTTRVYNLGNFSDPAGVGDKTYGAATPVFNTYAIDATKALSVTSAFKVNKTTKLPRVSAVADNIVQMRALYGLDDGQDNKTVLFSSTFVAGDGLVDRFVTAPVFNAAGAPWQSIIAVRVAVVARSALPEKPLGSDGANCDATTDGNEVTPGPDRRPKWADGTVIDVTASADPSPASLSYWKCYRYRVFETTVPLRNWIWKSS